MKNKSFSLSGTVIIIFGVTILSKGIGFLRDAIIAAYFGATASTDAYFFASSMPTLIFPTLCTAISTAFLSLYAEQCAMKSEQEAKRFASLSVSGAGFFAIGLSMLGAVLTPILVRVLAPGFNGETLSLAVRFSVILMPTFACNMCIYMINAILDTHKKHIVPQSIGLVSNVVIIAGILAGTTTCGIYALVISQLAASILQVIFVWGFAYKYFSFSGIQAIVSQQFRTILKLAVPIIVGNSLGQINQIVDKWIVSLFQDGAMSSLSYATTLCNVVYAVLVVPMLSIVYPRLSEKYALDEKNSLRKLLDNATSLLAIGLVPVMLCFVCFADSIVRIIYGRGEFDLAAVTATADMLKIYSWGFVSFGMRELYTKYFYAKKDTKTPMITSSISIVINIVLSVVLSFIYGINGIAIATTISLAIGAFMIVIQYYRESDEKIGKKEFVNWGKVIICGSATYILAKLVGENMTTGTILVDICIDALLITLMYGIFLVIFRYEPLMCIVKKGINKERL